MIKQVEELPCGDEQKRLISSVLEMIISSNNVTPRYGQDEEDFYAVFENGSNKAFVEMEMTDGAFVLFMLIGKDYSYAWDHTECNPIKSMSMITDFLRSGEIVAEQSVLDRIASKKPI